MADATLPHETEAEAAKERAWMEYADRGIESQECLQAIRSQWLPTILHALTSLLGQHPSRASAPCQARFRSQAPSTLSFYDLKSFANAAGSERSTERRHEHCEHLLERILVALPGHATSGRPVQSSAEEPSSRQTPASGSKGIEAADDDLLHPHAADPRPHARSSISGGELAIHSAKEPFTAWHLAPGHCSSLKVDRSTILPTDFVMHLSIRDQMALLPAGKSNIFPCQGRYGGSLTSAE